MGWEKERSGPERGGEEIREEVVNIWGHCRDEEGDEAGDWWMECGGESEPLTWELLLLFGQHDGDTLAPRGEARPARSVVNLHSLLHQPRWMAGSVRLITCSAGQNTRTWGQWRHAAVTATRQYISGDAGEMFCRAGPMADRCHVHECVGTLKHNVVWLLGKRLTGDVRRGSWTFTENNVERLIPTFTSNG